jgi:uncharacterized protein
VQYDSCQRKTRVGVRPSRAVIRDGGEGATVAAWSSFSTRPHMQAPERERLTQLVQRVLRYPDQARDIEIDRAAARLMAARSDTPQLLLQHVLVLEAALQQIQQQLHGLGTTLPPTAVRPDAPAVTPSRATVPATTGFLRDAAVIGTGVLGGSLIFHGLASAFEGSSQDTVGAAEDADLDFGSDLWG